MNQKSGSETIYMYTPVEAYGISTYAGGISSGGTGGDATSTQGVRFLWVYDPDMPDKAPSGFTGGGWYEDRQGSPIWHSSQFYSITLEDILAGFKDGTRENLNDVFTNWQDYVDAQGSLGNDVVQDFQYTVPRGCWSNLNS